MSAIRRWAMARVITSLAGVAFLVATSAAAQTKGCEPVAQRAGREFVQRAGGAGVMVRGGEPMILTGTGTSVRRSLVLILQDAANPRAMLATDWTPAGLCRVQQTGR
jgi:hypothetical protein